jgi:hypothetical protein
MAIGDWAKNLPDTKEISEDPGVSYMYTPNILSCGEAKYASCTYTPQVNPPIKEEDIPSGYTINDWTRELLREKIYNNNPSQNQEEYIKSLKQKNEELEKENNELNDTFIAMEEEIEELKKKLEKAHK